MASAEAGSIFHSRVGKSLTGPRITLSPFSGSL